MRRIAALVVAVTATLVIVQQPARADDVGPGANSCVDLRSVGRVGVLCQASREIPLGSAFHRDAGCTYRDANGDLKTDGTWWWTPHPVGTPPGIPFPTGVDPAAGVAAWLARLAAHNSTPVMLFDQWCRYTIDNDKHMDIVAQSVQVLITDPVLDPTREIDRIAAQILVPIPAPEITSLPDIKNWGGLVVNNPALLGVTSASWQLGHQTGTWLGSPLEIAAIPKRLDFRVNNIAITCIDGFVDPEPATAPRFPREPVGFRDTPLDPPDLPLGPRPCVWTPREPGTVSVTANVTYGVVATVAGGAFIRPDFTRTVTTNLDVVELRNVITEARTS